MKPTDFGKIFTLMGNELLLIQNKIKAYREKGTTKN